MKQFIFILMTFSYSYVIDVSGFLSPFIHPLHKESRFHFNIFCQNSDVIPSESSPGNAEQQIEKMANLMGMSTDQYQLGIKARQKMETEIRNFRATGGDLNKGVVVERDGLSPPIHLTITITEKGKSLGKDNLQKELIRAFKESSDGSKRGRDNAQVKMMDFIAEQIKIIGHK